MILLINPSRLFTNDFETNPYQPLGLAYLGAVLRENNEDVQILDAFAEGYNQLHRYREGTVRGLSFEEIVRRVKRLRPDYVGITTPFTANARSAYILGDLLRQYTTVVFGGAHATVAPKECLPHADIVVRGEGEFELLAIVRTPIPVCKHVVLARAIDDVNVLPLPARDLLPMETYFKIALAANFHRGLKCRTISMITSRGCPGRCCFCSTFLLHGRRWRARSSESIEEEVVDLKQTWHVDLVDFEDDNLTLDYNRALEICQVMKKHKVKWRTPNGIRADTVDRALLQAMKTSKCVYVRFAPESGSQRVVNEIIGKNLDLEAVDRAIDDALHVGLPVGCFFMIGFIGETKREIDLTIEKAEAYRRRGVQVRMNIACPLPGTRFHQEAVEGGYLKDYKNQDVSFRQALVETPEFSADYLRKRLRTFLRGEQRSVRERVLKPLRRIKSRVKPR